MTNRCVHSADDTTWYPILNFLMKAFADAHTIRDARRTFKRSSTTFHEAKVKYVWILKQKRGGLRAPEEKKEKG